MFWVFVRPGAAEQIRRLRRVEAVAILDALETHLRHEPERVSRSGIKRLRGKQDATHRLRVGNIASSTMCSRGQVIVTAVLHKRETALFYREEPE